MLKYENIPRTNSTKYETQNILVKFQQNEHTPGRGVCPSGKADPPPCKAEPTPHPPKADPQARNTVNKRVVRILLDWNAFLFYIFFTALNICHIFDSESRATNYLKEDTVFVHFVILLHTFSQKVITFQIFALLFL